MVGILGQLLQWAIKGERSGTCVRRNLQNTSGVLGRGHPYRSRQITPFFKTSNFTHVLRPLIFCINISYLHAQDSSLIAW